MANRISWQVTQHSRNVGFWCLVLFISHDLVWLVLPLASPVMEAIGGTNKTYDELIPEYPSVMPVKVPWLTKEIKYAYDLVVGIINTMPWVGSIVIYYSIVQLIKTQHEILGASLEHRRPIGGDDLEPMNFKLWVEDHVLLRKMMFELKETMSPTLAVTVTVNLLMVGLSMLALISHPVDPHASLTEKFSFYFSFSMYTCSCLCDLFVHCWLSSVLTNCGEVLRTALCKSYLIVNLEHPKDFLLPIMICSKEIKLTAFGMMSVQMQTFTEVLRLSYSYFTLLSSTQA